jgi:hypothetical protein
MPADITNLNKFRKARTRDGKQKQAEENRIRFGRTRAEKTLAGTREKQADKKLDGHRLTGDD